MGISTKIKNLNKVVKRLKKRKFTRVKEIVRDYGVRELLRRVGEKMDSGDVPGGRVYIITNESYIRDITHPAGFAAEQSVAFSLVPGALNVARLDILTQNSGGGSLTLEIFDTQNQSLLEKTVENVANGGYTEIDFLPIIDFARQRLRFALTAKGGAAIMVNRAKNRKSFAVEGGGSIVGRVYTRLDALYVHWLKNNSPTEEELAAQRAHSFPISPKISVVVPLYNTPETLLREMITSVTAQTYTNWELCLADGSTDEFDLLPIVSSFDDARIIYKKLDQNEGISGNTNKAIEMATGEYIALLDHDDTLTPHALYRNVEAINVTPDTDFLYSDEDKVTADGKRRFDPFFKPDFSPDMLNSFNYITHFTVIERSLLCSVGLLNSEYNGAQDYDLFLRATEKAKRITHIPDVLYNWRIIETSTAYSADSKSYTVAAGKAALEAALTRRGVKARVALGALPNYYDIVYDIPQPEPLVSIIIPNHNERATLKKCIDSIFDKTDYPNYEIVIVENNSTDKALFSYYETLSADPRIKIVTWNHPFNFAALNNYAAKQAGGDILLFMNNDMSVINADWLTRMVMHAVRPEIGCVGAKLFYPDDTVQHGGIVLRIGGIAGHSHKFSAAEEPGAFARLTLVHNVSAVTGACVMLRRNVFEEAGGFDEQFTVAYNDVDFGLKVRELGYYNLWTPHARLYHYESKTRGYEDTPEKLARLEREASLWRAKWEAKYAVDPFYNRNLTHNFEDYSIDPNKITR